MATMSCKQFLNQLDAWLEGEAGPDARGHVGACVNCRCIVEDLTAITVAARSLDDDVAEPPAHLWHSIRAQLEREGVIREPAADVKVASARRTGWFTFLPRPALALSYLSLLLVASFALSGPVTKIINRHQWIDRTQSATGPLGAQLDSVAQTTMHSVSANPIVTAALHKNLAIVDNYISLCEKSVREEPENEIARDYLYQAYQQKADLLAQMNERGE
jgi:hypothetical protein